MSLRDINPPADYQRGEKFYIRSGRLSVVTTTNYGPVGAAILFCDRAIEGGALHLLGNLIEVSESGCFDEANIILRRETCRFLRNKFSVGATLLYFLLAKEADQYKD